MAVTSGELLSDSLPAKRGIKMRALFVFLTFFLVACDSPLWPSGRSDSSGGSSGNSANIPWSPYLNTHNPGGVEAGYKEALDLLVGSGNLKGVRIGLDIKNTSGSIIPFYQAYGLEIVGIIDNYDLFNSNVEVTFDKYRKFYPEINIFQVGNEITTIIPQSDPQMPIEVYMDRLIRIYDHVQKNYPEVMLITQSTFGSGDYGARELQKMIQLGLKKMSPKKLIVGINCYTTASLNSYFPVITNELGGYRIWVMETGMADWKWQISHVQEFYPMLKHSLRAERVYWYVLWEDKDESDVNFSLIKSPLKPPIEMSPLFKVLAGLAESGQ